MWLDLCCRNPPMQGRLVPQPGQGTKWALRDLGLCVVFFLTWGLYPSQSRCPQGHL